MKKRMTAVYMSVILAFGTAAPVMAAEPQDGQEAVYLKEEGVSIENSEDSYAGTEKDTESFEEEDAVEEEAAEKNKVAEEEGERDAAEEEAAEKDKVAEEEGGKDAVEEAVEENSNTEDIEQTAESVSEDIVSDTEEPELSIQVPDMEIVEKEGGQLGVLPEGEKYDGENPEYPLDYLKEQGIYKKASSDSEGEAQAASINSSKVDLYVLDDGYKEYLTIPSNIKQSYQLSVTESGSVSYYLQSGDSVTVSSSGLIQPATTTWYWNGNIGSTVSTGAPGEKVEISYNYGTSVIRVVTGASTYYVTVTVHDYANYYAKKVMDAFLTKNITSGMTEVEKLRKIAAFPCNFDYDYRHSGYTGMIVCGGGDCWASCSAILYLCEKAGLPAHVRYGVNDPGAGSGHRNVAVKVGNSVYVVDAGYSGEAPRTYSMSDNKEGFYYASDGDLTARIIQYDGFESNITVPSQIDGYQVTSLGDSSFLYGERYSGVPVKSILLPETLETIGKSAFNSCGSIETITIPSSVNKIGDFVFTACSSLKEIKVKAGNGQYASSDGVLYDKGLKDLLYYPAGRTGAYKVPSGVKTIHGYSFYYTAGIHTLILPQSIEAVGEGAFGTSQLKRIYFQGNVPKFEEHAFHGLDLQGFYPKANTTWKNKPGNYDAYRIAWNAWQPVTNFRAAPAGKNKVRLSWGKQENVDGYLIYAQKSGKYGYAGMTSGGTAFTDVKALDQDYNFYWVFPYILDEGKIVDVPGMCGKYVYAKGVCPAVTNLKASSVMGGVKLTWSPSSGAEGYLVYGQVAGKPYGYVGMTTRGTTFTDKKASKSVYNFYWVFPYHKDAKGKMIVGGTPKYTYGRAK